MASDKKQESKVVVVEYKISMHCNACERSVAKIIAKFKGVERFTTDMNAHKVVVTGRIEEQKLLKKLRKKTGKRVEIIIHDDKKKKKKKKEGGDNNNNGDDIGGSSKDGNTAMVHDQYCCRESEAIFMMFSDENPNACSIV
ncbi:heavy metal-associated isoprenylated plant protein 19-like [Tripterygium wilfordii]|uniref:heavy metal-associated isoprenylated plant protein 19-like n=1 Tax=Tripterygium wilfordii TaxID=458696 RepID=UPI0018F857ED|nr:heavy metal-associated isoprenylated plant protein 19-like [Tripterygium wilfordii]